MSKARLLGSMLSQMGEQRVMEADQPVEGTSIDGAPTVSLAYTC